MTEWQPIETAPMDGTWILIWGGSADDGSENYHFSWKDPVKQMQLEMTVAEINARPVVARWNDEQYRDGWAYAAWDSAWRSFYAEPTHWMPLPNPPKVPA